MSYYRLMPLSESDPFARNLIVFSLILIAYYWGGGELITPNEIRLPLVNIRFTNGSFISGLAWVMYLWIIIRYVLEHGIYLKQEIRGELSILRQTSEFATDFAVRVGKLPRGDMPEFEHTHQPTNAIIKCNWISYKADGFTADETPKITLNKWARHIDTKTNYPADNEVVLLSKYQLRKFYLLSFLKQTFSNNRVFSQYVPYLLMVFAIWRPLVWPALKWFFEPIINIGAKLLG